MVPTYWNQPERVDFGDGEADLSGGGFSLADVDGLPEEVHSHRGSNKMDDI